MAKIAPPDIHYLNAAQGWLGLGNSTEARAEMKRLSRPVLKHPEALETQYQIFALEKNWEAALAVSQLIVEVSPKNVTGFINRSFSLHELKRTQEAWDQLLPMTEVFPRNNIVAYNLACYACQLGRNDEALKWLLKAMDLGGKKTVQEM